MLTLFVHLGVGGCVGVGSGARVCGVLGTAGHFGVRQNCDPFLAETAVAVHGGCGGILSAVQVFVCSVLLFVAAPGHCCCASHSFPFAVLGAQRTAAGLTLPSEPPFLGCICLVGILLPAAAQWGVSLQSVTLVCAMLQASS